MLLSLFSVKYLVLSMQSTLKDSDNPLEKDKFSLRSSYQLEMASGFWMMTCNSRSPYGTVLCRPFTCYISVCEFMYLDTIDLEGLVFLGMVKLRLAPICF